MPAATKIKVKAWKADVPAAMAAAMSRPVTATVPAAMPAIGRTATVRSGAPAIDGMTVAVIAGDDLLAIHGAAAGAAAMREAAGAASVTVIAGFGSRGGHHGKTSAESQESDELFHKWGMSVFGLAPQSSRHGHGTRLHPAIQAD